MGPCPVCEQHGPVCEQHGPGGHATVGNNETMAVTALPAQAQNPASFTK
jgi:hypothetical protein